MLFTFTEVRMRIAKTVLDVFTGFRNKQVQLFSLHFEGKHNRQNNLVFPIRLYYVITG